MVPIEQLNSGRSAGLLSSATTHAHRPDQSQQSQQRSRLWNGRCFSKCHCEITGQARALKAVQVYDLNRVGAVY